MSEEVKQEKWERKDWYIFSYETRLIIGVTNIRKKALAYGKLIINSDKISIGDFTLKFTNIVKFEKEKRYFIIGHGIGGRSYRLFMSTRSEKVRQNSRDKVLSILSEKIKQYEKVKIAKTVEIIKDLPKLYKELSLDDLSSRTNVQRKDLIKLLEKLILDGEIEAEISGNILKFRKEIDVPVSEPPLKTQVSPTSIKFKPKELSVLRGGDWKVEGDQSIFYYKVKVKNDSQLVVTNIQILLTSIPRGLETQTQMYKIESLKPGSFESPTFKLFAKESCVGDTVEGIVTFTDPTGEQQTAQIEQFEICYVCNLLTPKLITREEFEEKIDFMEEKKLIIDSDMDFLALESKITQIVKNCNFALLQEMAGSQSETLKKLDAFAEGLYDKQDVALSVTVKKMDEGSKLVVKAMSDRAEKVTDLLRDFSGKLDDIKSDTELIKEYTSQIEDLFDELGRLEDIEAYLKDHLASDFEKLKYAWEDYKAGDIDRKQLIWQGIKVIGKRFIPKILAKVIPIITK